MRYACIALLLAGCAMWSHKVKTIKEAPQLPDSSLAILEKQIEALEIKIQASRKPVNKVIPVHHDSTNVINWPDDRPYKFIFFYRKIDTNGNELPDPEIRFQYQQFNNDTTLGWVDLRERSDGVESDYWVRHDTLYVNIPWLRQFNPAPSDYYVFRLRFRLRLEDFFDERKNSGWVYARKVLNLTLTGRWDGVPQKPVFLEVH